MLNTSVELNPIKYTYIFLFISILLNPLNTLNKFNRINYNK